MRCLCGGRGSGGVNNQSFQDSFKKLPVHLVYEVFMGWKGGVGKQLVLRTTQTQFIVHKIQI